jgi:glutathione synthase/RimK-type ligase-like ATP-grasp enzyme
MNLKIMNNNITYYRMESIKVNYLTQQQNLQPGQKQQPEGEQPKQEVRLVDVPINDENTALNVMVGFLNLANRRGAYTIDESAKIWECVSKFQITRT